jgi:hypothetical protein
VDRVLGLATQHGPGPVDRVLSPATQHGPSESDMDRHGVALAEQVIRTHESSGWYHEHGVAKVYIRVEPGVWLPGYTRLVHQVVSVWSVEVEGASRHRGVFEAFLKRLCEALDAGEFASRGVEALQVAGVGEETLIGYMKRLVGDPTSGWMWGEMMCYIRLPQKK